MSQWDQMELAEAKLLREGRRSFVVDQFWPSRESDEHLRRQLLQQPLRLVQITRLEAFREPPVNGSQQFASLLHLALVAPEEAAQDRYLATDLRPRISG